MRHPIYVGLLIALMGTAAAKGTLLGIVALGLLLHMLMKARLEEAWFAAQLREGAYGGYSQTRRDALPSLDAQMIQEIFPSLFLIRPDVAPENTPFTYFLKRKDGNVLFATKQDLSGYAAQLHEWGGARHFLLGDRHHALPATAAFARRFGATLSASATEAKALAAAGVPIGREIESKRGLYVPDLEVIPTPGHTRGALSYLWSNAGRRFLFIGDTLVPIDDEWHYWVTKPNRATMRRTVELLATVKFDVILSNSFAASPTPWIEFGDASRKRLFANLTARLED